MRVARSARFCFVVGVFLFHGLRSSPGMSSSDQHLEAGHVPSFADDYRIHLTVATLRQNSDNRFRLIVPGKCADEGERELRQLASDSALEESFVFLPSRCLWIELGFDESPVSVRSEADIVLSLAIRHEPIVIYHTHVRTHTDTTGGFPAYRDLVGSILLGGDQPLTDGRPIVHRAVTAEGVFEYSVLLTPDVIELIQAIKSSGLEGKIAQNLAYLFATASYERKYYDLVRYCTQNGGQAKRLGTECFPMNSHPFILKYWAIGESHR